MAGSTVGCTGIAAACAGTAAIRARTAAACAATAPGWTAPGWTAPGWTAPGWTAPGWTAPGWTAPGWTAPGWTGAAAVVAFSSNVMPFVYAAAKARATLDPPKPNELFRATMGPSPRGCSGRGSVAM